MLARPSASRNRLLQTHGVDVRQRVVIRRLETAEARAHLDGLASVLRDCVEGGASVG